MRIEWRRLPTVLTEDEMLDKAFGRAKKAADRVEDSNRVFRTRNNSPDGANRLGRVVHHLA